MDHPCPSRPALQVSERLSCQSKIQLGTLFAFFPEDVLADSNTEWLVELLGLTAIPRKVVPLFRDRPLLLPGARHQPLVPSPPDTLVIVSDKNLYRDGEETVSLLVVDPCRPDVELSFEVHWNGSLSAHQAVRIGPHGAVTCCLRGLPTGSYELKLAGDAQPRCEFQVAQYRLAPLVARIVERKLTGASLAFLARLESFGIPVEGEVDLEVPLEKGQRTDKIRLPCHEGLLDGSIDLAGEGPFSINLQLVSDPSRTATLPVVGTRAAERCQTVFSGLGVEVLGSLLPGEGDEVRGLYVDRGAARTSPLTLFRVNTRRGILTAREPLGPLSVVVLDPTYQPGPSAQDRPHPAKVDRLYAQGEALFREKEYLRSLQPLLEGRRLQADPHPYYAYELACSLARLGRKKEAMGWLEQAIRDGWWEHELLATDPDLESLHALSEWARLLGRGRVTLDFPHLEKGQTVEFDVASPMGLVALGAFTQAGPWEGWAALVTPDDLPARLMLPSSARPGETLELSVENVAPSAVYLLVKDARLISSDTALSRLAANLKSCVADCVQDWYPAPAASLSHFVAEAFRSQHQDDPFAQGPVALGSFSADPFASYSADPFGVAFGGPYAATADPFLGPPPTAAAQPQAAAVAVLERVIEKEPEVLFAGLLPLEGGRAVLRLDLGQEVSDLTVEAFVFQGRDWKRLEGRIRVAADPRLSLEVPPFVHPGDQVYGRVRAGTFEGSLAVKVLRDGETILEESAERNLEALFPVVAGHYEAQVVGLSARRTARVETPGSFRFQVKSLRLLQPQESFTKSDDVVALRVLPGLDESLTSLASATSNYGHSCCEQTAAKLVAAFSLYANGDEAQKVLAESSILAGLTRLQTMWVRGGGFRSYPDMTVDNYWGPTAVRHLWSLHALRELPMSAGLAGQLSTGLEMLRDTSDAYRIAFPPDWIKNAQDAYWVLRCDPSRSREAVEWLLPQLGDWESWFANDRVGGRVQAAFAAGLLLRAQQQMPVAIKLANRVTRDLNAQGRLYSTLDSVAALVLFAELKAAGVTAGAGRLRLDGEEVDHENACGRSQFTTVEAVETVCLLQVTRNLTEDWSNSTTTVPLAVALEKAGRPTWTVRPGDSLDLSIKLEAGYQAGDLAWVCLPEALSRVVGGGQVKLFSVDFEGRSQLRVPLVVTGAGSGEQTFCVSVRNMYSEERSGSPGPLTLTLKGG